MRVAVTTVRLVAARALKIALVVGTLLNAINQGDQMLAGRISWWHFVLNYVVPFCVATYSGTRALSLSCHR